MEHKAFAFNYDEFSSELRDLLLTALETKNTELLKKFIESNIDALKDPYEGEQLDENWEDMIETADAHQYGDFALTRYYDPADDIGLGDEWQRIHELTAGKVIDGESPILGTPLGPESNLFDPGKMGAYFQSPDTVKLNLEFLKTVQGSDDAIEIFQASASSRSGLYITF